MAAITFSCELCALEQLVRVAIEKYGAEVFPFELVEVAGVQTIRRRWRAFTRVHCGGLGSAERTAASVVCGAVQTGGWQSFHLPPMATRSGGAGSKTSDSNNALSGPSSDAHRFIWTADGLDAAGPSRRSPNVADVLGRSGSGCNVGGQTVWAADSGAYGLSSSRASVSDLVGDDRRSDGAALCHGSWWRRSRAARGGQRAQRDGS